MIIAQYLKIGHTGPFVENPHKPLHGGKGLIVEAKESMHLFTIHRSIYLKDTPFLTLKYLARLVILMPLMTMMAVEGGYVRVAGVRI